MVIEEGAEDEAHVKNVAENVVEKEVEEHACVSCSE